LSLEPAETEKARRPDVAALLLGLALLALAALVAWDASRLGGGATYAQVGPKSFPYVIAGGLTLLSVWTMVAAWLGDVPAREPDEVAPILWIVGGLLAQMLLLGVAGFSIATGVMLGLVARGFGERRLWLTIPAGILVSLVLFFVFNRGLQLTLPGGPLERLF
jgi:putative tricarboxylic transport membrane protein